jgi:hypothetical protein
MNIENISLLNDIFKDFSDTELTCTEGKNFKYYLTLSKGNLTFKDENKWLLGLSDTCHYQGISAVGVSTENFQYDLNTRFIKDDCKISDLNREQISSSLYEAFIRTKPTLWGCSDDFDEEDDEDDCEVNDNERKRKRGCKPNPDAEIIAAATAENLKVLNLDPNSKEGKKQKRRIRNRMSAQLHRERKKEYILFLEGIIQELNKKNDELVRMYEMVKSENDRLREEIRLQSNVKKSFNGNYQNSSTSSETGDNDVDMLSYSCEESILCDHSDLSYFSPSWAFDDDTSAQTYSESSSNTLRTFGPSFSLLSLLFILTFTLFGNSPTLNFGSPLSTSQSGADSHFALASLNLESSLFQNQDLQPTSLSKNSDLKLKANDVEISESYPLKDNSDIITSQQGREISKTPSSKDDFNSTKAETLVWTTAQHANIVTHLVPYVSPPKGTVNEVADISSQYPIMPTLATMSSFHLSHLLVESKKNELLWTDAKQVVPLYPYYTQSLLDNVRNHYQSLPIKSKPSYTSRHLRTRMNAESRFPSPRIETDNYATRKAMVSYIYDSKLGEEQQNKDNSIIPFAQDDMTHSDAPLYAEGQRLPLPSLSQVHVKSGKALLDPTLAVGILPIRQSDSYFGGNSEANSKRESSSDSKMSLVSSTLSTINAYVNPSNSNRHDARFHPVSEPSVALDVVKSTGSQDPHMLMMLLPASAVRWGKSWNDGSISTETLLNGFNQTDHDFDDDSDVKSQLWIEIGCNVFRAKIVRNVTVM